MNEAKEDKITCPFCQGSRLCKVYEDANEHYIGCHFCNETGEVPVDLFTCHTCSKKHICPFAWDAYNTNNDCLAEK